MKNKSIDPIFYD